MISDPPSTFVVEWLPKIAALGPVPARALDVAMGRGRHALALASAGFRTFGVELKFDAVRDAIREASARSLTIHAWCADLTAHPLPHRAFDLVLVTRYLQRDLFESLAATIVPRGALIYETFTVNQRALGAGPTSPDHLLAIGELRERFRDFDVLFYEEVVESEAVARIVARKPAE